MVQDFCIQVNVNVNNRNIVLIVLTLMLNFYVRWILVVEHDDACSTKRSFRCVIFGHLSPGVDFTKLVCQAKSCRQTAFGKKSSSISPTLFTHQVHNCIAKKLIFLPNAVCSLPNLCPQKASHPVRAKKPRAYVDEINPLSQSQQTVLLDNAEFFRFFAIKLNHFIDMNFVNELKFIQKKLENTEIEIWI